MSNYSNATWAGMIAMGLRLFVHCTPCDKSVEIDMTRLPPEGKAIGARFRCKDCNRLGTNAVIHKSAYRAVPYQRSCPRDTAGLKPLSERMKSQ